MTERTRHTDRFEYSYDRNSNRTSRDNLLNANFDEVYSYDGLNQLTGFERGTHTRDWDYDALGNWDSVTTDGGTPQTRSHNQQNEITSVSGLSTPGYDANGNMTSDETGKQFVYDAWNRLVKVKTSGGATLVRYEYDGLFRRVSETASGVVTDLYYSDAWQVLEERVDGDVYAQYVWSPVYVDALVLRDRDSDANGSLEERLWVQQDANFNVTAVLNGSGVVQERYTFDPFGMHEVRDAAWSIKSGGSDFGWLYLHQGGRFNVLSGLYSFRFREYSPTLGRWVTMDPIEYHAGDANLYRYLSGNPIDHVDPFGLLTSLQGCTQSPAGAKLCLETGVITIGTFRRIMSGFGGAGGGRGARPTVPPKPPAQPCPAHNPLPVLVVNFRPNGLPIQNLPRGNQFPPIPIRGGGINGPIAPQPVLIPPRGMGIIGQLPKPIAGLPQPLPRPGPQPQPIPMPKQGIPREPGPKNFELNCPCWCFVPDGSYRFSGYATKRECENPNNPIPCRCDYNTPIPDHVPDFPRHRP